MKATQWPISFRGISWHRYRDGKLVEGWDSWNYKAVIEQLSAAAG
jgi:predicted SnoaL-like aldol condensation-catalyzing enzyme